MLAGAKELLLKQERGDPASGADHRGGLAWMSEGGIAPWRDSVVGVSKNVRAGCIVEVPAQHAGGYVDLISAGLHRIHFRVVPPHQETAERVRVFRRGSSWQETLLLGSGLSLFSSKVGPLSLEATVVIEQTAAGGGSTRVIAAVVTHSGLNREFAAVVDGALQELVTAGVSVTGPGCALTMYPRRH